MNVTTVRLALKAGVAFVTLDLSYHTASGTWDNHGDNIPPYGGISKGLKPLLPLFDHMITTLVTDLEERGLVTYQPYKGVSLTPTGREITRRILRHRRLWETFLVQHLHTAQAEADALACRLEHITSEPIAAQLDAYLGSPTASPSGRPIPAGSASPPDPGLPLTLMQAGDRAQVLQLSASPPQNAFLQS